MALDTISSILQNTRNQKEISPALLCIYLSRHWETIVGKKWNTLLRPVGYQHHCLQIKVPSSCHIQELQFHTEQLIQTINQSLGDRYIQNIRYVL